MSLFSVSFRPRAAICPSRWLPVTAASLLLASPVLAQTTGKVSGYVAMPSTRAISEVSLTLADTAAQRAAGKPALLRIDYGQPHLRGRRINTDSLVPFDKVWRLGANGATVFQSDVDLTIGGMAVPRGRYVAQVLPARSAWTLILQRETTGAATVAVTAYDASKDVARIPLTVSTLSTPVESFFIWLVPANTPGAAKGVLTMAWGTVQAQTEWSVR